VLFSFLKQNKKPMYMCAKDMQVRNYVHKLDFENGNRVEKSA